MKKARAAWREEQPEMDVAKLVFVDESSAKTNMARLYGRGPVGERVEGSAPAGDWSTTTMLSAVAIDGPRAPWVLEGAVDAEAFVTWVERVLVPTLDAGDVVVMDNLSAHKDPRVAAAVEAAGATVVYLPLYSPDFNPIENMWSKVKAWLRKAAARTADTLLKAIAAGLAAVTPSDCRGFFGHCGYNVAATSS